MCLLHLLSIYSLPYHYDSKEMATYHHHHHSEKADSGKEGEVSAEVLKLSVPCQADGQMSETGRNHVHRRAAVWAGKRHVNKVQPGKGKSQVTSDSRTLTKGHSQLDTGILCGGYICWEQTFCLMMAKKRPLTISTGRSTQRKSRRHVNWFLEAASTMSDFKLMVRRQ